MEQRMCQHRVLDAVSPVKPPEDQPAPIAATVARRCLAYDRFTVLLLVPFISSSTI